MKGPLAHQMAVASAQEAVDNAVQEYGEDNAAFLYCGFAWAIIRPARGAFINEMKRAGIGSKSEYGGYRISNYAMFNLPPGLSQSMELKEIGARAYCKALGEYGINATMSSRAD